MEFIDHVVGEDDYKITCKIPPEGFIWNYLDKQFQPSEILCRSAIRSDQYWEAPERPFEWKKKRRKEKAMQLSDPLFVDPELEAYREQEWRRRLFGVWFMNNGQATYITGANYMFLTHWQLDIGLPDYRNPDREFFLAWKHCEDSTDCAGLIILTKRRQGKTAKSGLIMYDRVSRTRRAIGGIQSKKEDDAAKIVFFAGLVLPFINLIDFFIPKFDKGRDFPPKEELRFFPRGKRGEQVDIDDYDEDDYLNSWIGFKDSGETAYDGWKLNTYIGDEIAKTDNVDVNRRHYVVRKTLLGQDGYSILGKALYTTTVEEMNVNSDSFRKLWDESDQNELSANKRTKSWLYRFFIPAHKTLYFDKYGFADEIRARQTFMNERDALRGEPHRLATVIRQDPFTWHEAFRADGETGLYNPLIIENRLEYLTWRKNIYQRGALEWVDDTRKEVRFIEQENGRFYVALPPDLPNDVKWLRSDTPAPVSTLRYVIGVDPFDHDRTKDGRFSLGAAAVYKRHDSLKSEGQDNFVAIYLGRPPHTHIFYEDMVKLCHWYGCKMLFEDNKVGIKNYFDLDRLYGAFLMRDAAGDVGISGSAKAHLDIVEETGIFIQDHGDRVMFHQLLRQWREFDMYDTEKFDLAMASGYALIANSRMRRGLEKFMKHSSKQQISSLFPKRRLRSNANV